MNRAVLAAKSADADPAVKRHCRGSKVQRREEGNQNGAKGRLILTANFAESCATRDSVGQFKSGS